MDEIRTSFVKQCIDTLKTERVKNEIRNLCEPIADVALQVIYPYMYVVFVLVFLLFVLIISIICLLVIMLRSVKVKTAAIVET